MAKGGRQVSPKVSAPSAVYGMAVSAILEAPSIPGWQAALRSAGEGCRNRCRCHGIFNTTRLNLERFQQGGGLKSGQPALWCAI